LESIYEEALCYEFDLRGIRYHRQAPVEMHYKDKAIKDQRIDLIVEDEDDRAVVDLKSVSRLPEIATAQVSFLFKGYPSQTWIGHQLW
jgi:GxxExxY protein